MESVVQSAVLRALVMLRRCRASLSPLWMSANTYRYLRRLTDSAANTPGVASLSVMRNTCVGGRRWASAAHKPSVCWCYQAG